MGIGDELMAAGEAGKLAAGTSKRFLIMGKRGEPKWHFAWEGNPHIARPGEPHDDVITQHKLRPYIEAATPERWTWREYSPIPAQIQLTPRARELARHVAGAIVFNPTIKRGASPNKDWGFERWKLLVTQNLDFRWVQIGEAGPRIRGAEQLPTADFFEACGAVFGAAAVVVHEGALHHVAAAFGTPAVVIRGGYISPFATGYVGQADCYVWLPDWPQYARLGCGMRLRCPHCEAAMAAITPEDVVGKIRMLQDAEWEAAL